MLRSLKGLLWLATTKRTVIIESSIALSRVIETMNDQIIDLQLLMSLAQVCRTTRVAAGRLIKEFRSIVVKPLSLGRLTPEQLLLYRVNGHYTKGHSWWFVAAAFEGIVDAMLSNAPRVIRKPSLLPSLSQYTYSSISLVTETSFVAPDATVIPLIQEGRVLCRTLGCPTGCTKKLSDTSKICLLHSRVSTKKHASEGGMIKTKFFSTVYDNPLREFIMPWLIYSGGDINLISSLYSNDYNIRLTYEILIHESSLFDGYWGNLYQAIRNRSPTSVEHYQKNETKLIALRAIRMILGDPSTNFHSYAREATMGISDILGGAIIISIRLLYPTVGSVSRLNLLHYVTTKGFAIFLDRGSVAQSLTFAVANIALRLTGEHTYWPTPLPVGIGATTLVFESTMRTTIVGTLQTFGCIDSYSKFIVLTYLLGIPPSLIIITDDSLVPVGFEATELFTDSTLMVSDIIFEIGGRQSENYITLRTKCIAMLCRIRSHYSFLTELLAPLLTPLVVEELIRRWSPGQSGEPIAIATFIARLENSAKGTFGFWTFLGY